LKTAAPAFSSRPWASGRRSGNRRCGRAGQDRLHINQIAHHLKAGRPGDVMEGRIQIALRELGEWRTALMQALGFERNRKPPK